MRISKFILVMLLSFATVALASCGSGEGEKQKPVFVDEGGTADDSTYSESDTYATSGNVVEIPFQSKGGVKYVQVSVDGVGLEMIFDTGCSTALISVAEANYLHQKGKLTKDDILGVTKSQIADGSISENMVVNLKEVVIGDQVVCTDVQATVSNSVDAPLLLGNEVLDRLGSCEIDNERNVLIFKLKQ